MKVELKCPLFLLFWFILGQIPCHCFRFFIFHAERTLKKKVFIDQCYCLVFTMIWTRLTAHGAFFSVFNWACFNHVFCLSPCDCFWNTTLITVFINSCISDCTKCLQTSWTMVRFSPWAVSSRAATADDNVDASRAIEMKHTGRNF